MEIEEKTTETVAKKEADQPEGAVLSKEDKAADSEQTKASYRDHNDNWCWLPYGVTSFADLDALERANKVTDMAAQMTAMVYNIMENPDIEDKATAVRALANEFEQMVGEVDNKERWQDRVSKYVKDLVKTEAQKQKEAASEPMTEEVAKKGMFTLIKQADGSYRWLAFYSNKFRDDDNPPEIIAEESHKRFVKMVDEGLVEPPELWCGHVDGTRWGVADVVAYDDSGFALASGTVDKGKEHIADNMRKEGPLPVSHGMPTAWIKRDAQDPTIITHHITKEISPLPAPWVPANRLTGFHILDSEDKQMALESEKRDKLANLGFDVAGIEAAAGEKAAQAETEGLESKQTEDNKKTEETQVEDTPAAQAEPETTESTTEATPEDTITRAEMTEVVQAMGQSVNQLTQVVAVLSEDVKALKSSDDEKLEQKLADTPAASLASLWQSAIGSKAAKVDGRTKLGKDDGPEETEPPKHKSATGINFLDNLTAPRAQ